MAKNEYIKIDFKKRRMEAGVFYVELDDHGQTIIYAPSLNLSAYGENAEEAEEMLHVVIRDFSDNLMKLSESEVAAELQEHGWSRDKIFRKKFETGKSYIDKEGILKDFDLPSDTKVREKFLAV